MGPRAYARPCACCGNVHTQDCGEMSVDSCDLCKKSPICGFCAWRIPYVCCSCYDGPEDTAREHEAALSERPRQLDNEAIVLPNGGQSSGTATAR